MSLGTSQPVSCGVDKVVAKLLTVAHRWQSAHFVFTLLGGSFSLPLPNLPNRAQFFCLYSLLLICFLTNKQQQQWWLLSLCEQLSSTKIVLRMPSGQYTALIFSRCWSVVVVDSPGRWRQLSPLRARTASQQIALFCCWQFQFSTDPPCNALIRLIVRTTFTFNLPSPSGTMIHRPQARLSFPRSLPFFLELTFVLSLSQCGTHCTCYPMSYYWPLVRLPLSRAFAR